MSRKYIILVISVVLIGLSSCVSKKKYLEMEAGRLKAEELSRKLDAENNAKAERIKALIADFEAMKNELMESNAMKEQDIADLKKEMAVLNEELNSKQESLQETSFNLDFEKQRLTNALESKEASIQSLQNEVSTLETEVSEKNSALDQTNFEINRLNQEAKVLEGKIEVGENELKTLQGQLDNVRSETQQLQNQLKEKDSEITKLSNQVKLLKDQIGN